jgi:HD-like signal output (HDOD) protein
MAEADFFKRLRDVQDLPALPDAATKVLELAQSEETTVEDLSGALSQDQALAGKTLKLVNSPYYGFPRRIGKISEAVVILGFKTIKNLAVSVSVCDFFSGGSEGLDRRQLWKHSVGVAVAAAMVAKHTRMTALKENAFISGLLHDIGLLVEDRSFQPELSRALTMAEEQNLPIEEAENEVFGLDHALIGKKVAEIWKLPERICSSIGFHHQPQYALGEARQEASLVYVADLICKLKGFGFDGDQAVPKLKKVPFQVLSLDKSDLKELSKTFDEEIGTARDFLEMGRSAA